MECELDWTFFVDFCCYCQT